MTTGVTFTFGGLKISQKGEVEDLYGRIIPGLYAAGEMVGGRSPASAAFGYTVGATKIS